MSELTAEARHAPIHDRNAPVGAPSRRLERHSADVPASREFDETRLEAEARLLRKRLELVLSSPGWRILSAYRRGVRRGIGRHPRLKSWHDRFLKWFFRRALGIEAAQPRT